MSQSSYTIRAAALERLVDNIIPMFEKLRSSLSDETFGTDQEPFEGLEELKSLYPNSGFAVAYFPTKNLEVLLRLITTIIRIYHVFPQIHGKIETCYCFQKILTKSDEAKNKRGLEIKELSTWFHTISQQLNGKTFNTRVSLIKKTDHGFHPDSEFALCTVNFID